MMQAGPKNGQRADTLARLVLSMAAAVILGGCIPAEPGRAAMRALGLGDTSVPAMAWDHRPEAADWTRAALAAVASEDAALATRVPEDIGAYCPAYAAANLDQRRAFWVGFLSAIAKYESSWNPRASGGGGRYIGLMQISPRSAQNYGCEATSRAALKDGAANLACAVQMASQNVARDAVVAGPGNRGVGRDWMPLRNATKRAAIADWVSAQSYCKV
jgi:soluble lytic murein transglycosylase-like protein